MPRGIIARAGSNRPWAALRPLSLCSHRRLVTSTTCRVLPTATPCVTVAARFMSGGCPMASPTATPTSTPVDAASVPHCPVAGPVPPFRCPVEGAEASCPHADVTGEMRQLTPREIVSQLAKTRLSGFVTATAVVGYVLCGGTSVLASTAIAAGTFLQSCSANTTNQVLEVEYDRHMKRTCRRPLVTGAITRPAALALSAAQVTTGTAMLYALSPAAAGLGVLNWFLYVGMYTPLKRISTTNTWWGAIVGAIPPLMGGAVVTGTAALTSSMAPAYLLGAVMFVWQIPHFMSLAFHCRRDYEAAGFKMLPFHHPLRASRYSVALTVVMAAGTIAGPALIGMPVEAWYYPLSVVANGAMLYKTVLFHQDPVRHCRGCFVFSYLYLAIMLVALTVNHFQPVGCMVSGVERLFKEDSAEVPVIAKAA